MKVNRLRLLKVLVDNDPNLFLAVIEQSERGNSARIQPEEPHQPLGRGKAEPVFSQLFFQRFQVRPLGTFDNDQIMPVSFFVAQKKILAVRSGNVSPVLLGLLHSEDWGVLVPDIGNVETLQSLINLLFFFRRHCLFLPRNLLYIKSLPQKRIYSLFHFFQLILQVIDRITVLICRTGGI